MSRSFVSSLVALCCVQASAWVWADNKAKHNRTVDVRQLNDMFTDMVERAKAGSAEVSAIAVSMRSTYNAMPKNKFQRLSHSAASYLVHDYFAQNHQWHFRGLGAGRNGAQYSVSSRPSFQDETIPQDMAPEVVEELLEAHGTGQGLTLSDAAAMAATLKSLVLNDAEEILMKAYEWRGFPVEQPIRTLQIPDLLKTFAFMEHGKQSLDALERRIEKPSYFMYDFTEHTISIMGRMAYQGRGRINPFKHRHFTFDFMLDAVKRSLATFGEYQAGTCVEMKNHLIKLDPSSSGRVPLGVFYAQPDMHSYRFHESLDYLKEIGSADTSVPNFPQVLISNYVLGPANCYASNTYFQFCCVNNCMRLLSEIENYVGGPEATPEEFIHAVGNASDRVSAEMAEQSQELPEELLEKLLVVAKRHNGKVPLHSRLLTQWIHFAFPSECPYPHMPKPGATNEILSANDFMNANADKNEMQHYINASGGVGNASVRTLSQWTDEEMLSLVDAAPQTSLVRGIMRAVAIFLAISAMGVTLVRGSKRADMCNDFISEDFRNMDKFV